MAGAWCRRLVRRLQLLMIDCRPWTEERVGVRLGREAKGLRRKHAPASPVCHGVDSDAGAGSKCHRLGHIVWCGYLNRTCCRNLSSGWGRPLASGGWGGGGVVVGGGPGTSAMAKPREGRGKEV
jgi:hypothetical protein